MPPPVPMPPQGAVPPEVPREPAGVPPPPPGEEGAAAEPMAGGQEVSFGDLGQGEMFYFQGTKHLVVHSGPDGAERYAINLETDERIEMDSADSGTLATKDDPLHVGEGEEEWRPEEPGAPVGEPEAWEEMPAGMEAGVEEQKQIQSIADRISEDPDLPPDPPRK